MEADWTAQAGYYYYVTENYTKRKVGCNREVRESAGNLRRDQLTTSSMITSSADRGVDPRFVHAIEPFPTNELVPYDPGYVSGWMVERYQVDSAMLRSPQKRRWNRSSRKCAMRRFQGTRIADCKSTTIFR